MNRSLNVLFAFILLCVSGAYAQSDIKIKSVTSISEYSEIPLKQATNAFNFGVTIENNGMQQLNNVKAKYTVLRSGTVFFEDSITIDSLQLNQDTTINFVNPTASIVKGTYQIEYEISHDSVDVTPSDNFGFTDSLIIGDSVLKRFLGFSDTLPAYGYETSSNIGPELGSSFFVPTTDTITSVTIGFRGNSTLNSMTNNPYSARIRSFTNGTPGNVIANSDTIIYTASGPTFVTFPFSSHVPLSADTFVVTAVDHGNSTMIISSIHMETKKYKEGTQWIQSTPPHRMWITPNNIMIRFDDVFIVEANFGKPSSPTAVNQLRTQISNFRIYPNPSNSLFSLEIISQKAGEKINLQVIDNKGSILIDKWVYTKGVLSRENVDLVDFPKGVYFIKLTQGKDKYTRRIVKK